MKIKISIKIPRLTRILLGVFGVLVVGMVFVGLDNEPGIVLGWAATAVLIAELTRRWRRVRNFLILGFGTFTGTILLAFLHEEVVYPLAGWIGGSAALQSQGLRIFNEVVSLLILFFTPVGIFIGITGAVALLVARLVTLLSRKDLPRQT